jgi:hypothetical protein
MASLAGFLIGVTLTRKGDEENRVRNGLIAGLMPSPLIGAVVVSAIESRDDDNDDDGNDNDDGDDGDDGDDDDDRDRSMLAAAVVPPQPDDDDDGGREDAR